jgi:hypothetical protein
MVGWPAVKTPELDHHVLPHDVAVVAESSHDSHVVGIALRSEGRHGADKETEAWWFA